MSYNEMTAQKRIMEHLEERAGEYQSQFPDTIGIDDRLRNMQTEKLISISGMFSIFLLFVIVLQGKVGMTEGIAAYLIYSFIYLSIARKTEAIPGYFLLGRGSRSYPYLKDLILTKPQRKQLTFFFKERQLPSDHSLLPTDKKKELYEAMKYDIKHRRTPYFQELNSFTDLFESQQTYVAAFMLPVISVTTVILFGLLGGDEILTRFNGLGSQVWKAGLEELIFKGFVFFTILKVHKMDKQIFVNGRKLSEAGLLGVATGIGYACFETLSRLARHDYNIFANLVLRTLTTLPLHMITTGITFIGLYYYSEGKKQSAAVWLSISIMLHATYNASVGGLL